MGFFTSFMKKPTIKWFLVFETEAQARNLVPLNRAVTVQVEDKKICLARTQSGWYAVADACPHLGASLSKGTCNINNEITCPWHSYRFDLKLGHERSGAATGMGVETYPVELRNNGLFIGIDAQS